MILQVIGLLSRHLKLIMLTGTGKDSHYKTLKTNCILLQKRVEAPAASATPPEAPAAAGVKTEPKTEESSADLAHLLFGRALEAKAAEDVD